MTQAALTGWKHPTGAVPQCVAVVGLGPSHNDYFQHLIPHQPQVPWSETWSINTGLRIVPGDLCFIMDDMRDYGDRHPVYGKLMADALIPIITNAVYEEYPNAIAYPLDLVRKHCAGSSEFHGNSVPYILAYACFIGVQRLCLFGVDYSGLGIWSPEEGREVAAHWIGFCRGRGMTIDITENSTLMQSNRKGRDPSFRKFYGYLRQP